MEHPLGFRHAKEKLNQEIDAVTSTLSQLQESADESKYRALFELSKQHNALLSKKVTLIQTNETLNQLILKNPNPTIQGELVIDVPPSCDVTSIFEECKRLVLEFNNLSNTTEKSGSINLHHSVHRLWRDLFYQIMTLNNGFQSTLNIGYECNIMNPLSSESPKSSCYKMDFAFYLRHQLNWFGLAGGLEAKINPKDNRSGRSDAPGPMASGGFRQALSRAAMCVFIRWSINGCIGLHSSHCYFADARRLGVVQVDITEGNIVSVRKSQLMDLPGYNNSTSTDALKVIAHLFQCSHAADLNLNRGDSVTEVKGYCVGTQSQWTLGKFLGEGGFAAVFEEDETVGQDEARGASKMVIKIPTSERSYDKLVNEVSILASLQHVAIPVVHSTLYDANYKILAIKFKTRGLPMQLYINSIADDIELLKKLINWAGPTIVSVLQFAHTNEVVHRDIRIPNILLVISDNALRQWDDFHANILGETNTNLNLQSLDLAGCSLIVNDWGEALNINLDPDKKDLILNDLLYCIEMLAGLHKVPADSNRRISDEIVSGSTYVLSIGSLINPLISGHDKFELSNLASNGPNYKDFSSKLLRI